MKSSRRREGDFREVEQANDQREFRNSSVVLKKAISCFDQVDAASSSTEEEAVESTRESPRATKADLVSGAENGNLSKRLEEMEHVISRLENELQKSRSSNFDGLSFVMLTIAITIALALISGVLLQCPPTRLL